jgi:lysophospholipase L1-like esterase
MNRAIVLGAAAIVAALPASVATAHARVAHGSHAIRYVSLGDSVTATTPSFVELTARRAAGALHRKVTITRVVEEGAVSRLASRVRNDAKLRSLLRSADLITVTLGANEIGASIDRVSANTCGGADHLDCVRTAEKAFERSYRALLDQLAGLRSPRKAAFRLLTSYDTPSAFSPDLRTPFSRALRAENAFVCSEAARHAMKCADVYAGFNGADGSQDPLTSGLVVPDGHPSAKGSARIAEVISRIGFAPLR